MHEKREEGEGERARRQTGPRLDADGPCRCECSSDARHFLRLTNRIGRTIAALLPNLSQFAIRVRVVWDMQVEVARRPTSHTYRHTSIQNVTAKLTFPRPIESAWAGLGWPGLAWAA